jgi:hypothetical protein
LALLTIDDLGQEGWQNFLPYVHQLGEWYHQFKKVYNEDRDVKIAYRKEGHRKVGVHASEISKCLRLLTYAVMSGVKRKVSAEDRNVNMQMRFDLGTAVHALIQDDLHKTCAMFGSGYLQFTDEVGIKPSMGGFAGKWHVYSHTDGIFTFLDQNEQPCLRVGLEIKTKSGPEFDKLKAPDPDHVEQAHIYMKCLDLPLMWFFYYNKSNSNWTKPMAPYLITFDHKLMARLESRIASAYEFANQGKLPDRQEGMYCSWCPFAHDCDPSYLRMVKLRSSKGPPKPGAFRR